MTWRGWLDFHRTTVSPTPSPPWEDRVVALARMTVLYVCWNAESAGPDGSVQHRPPGEYSTYLRCLGSTMKGIPIASSVPGQLDGRMQLLHPPPHKLPPHIEYTDFRPVGRNARRGRHLTGVSNVGQLEGGSEDIGAGSKIHRRDAAIRGSRGRPKRKGLSRPKRSIGSAAPPCSDYGRT